MSDFIEKLRRIYSERQPKAQPRPCKGCQQTAKMRAARAQVEAQRREGTNDVR